MSDTVKIIGETRVNLYEESFGYSPGPTSVGIGGDQDDATIDIGIEAETPLCKARVVSILEAITVELKRSIVR